MPEYLAPGVYMEEVDAGTKPIEGVSTSTAGFIGVTQRGPDTGLPTLVTSFPEFQRRFGGYLNETWGDARWLAYSVRGFFENGGLRAYIKRVPGQGSVASNVLIPDGIIVRLAEDMAASPTSARLTATRGISVGTNVTFQETVNGVPVSDTRAVATYNSDTGVITWAGALGRAYTRAGASVQIRATSGAQLRVDARDRGEWGDALRVQFEYTTPSRSDMVAPVTITLSNRTDAPAFAAAGPAIGATTTNLAAGHGLATNDWVEFVAGANRERRQVTVAVNTITWVGGLLFNYAVGGTIRTVMVARVGANTVNAPAALAATLQNNDAVRISGNGLTEDLTVQGVAAGVITFTTNTANAYQEGATLELRTTAIRAGQNSLRVRSSRNFYVGALVELDNGTNKAYFIVQAITGNTLVLNGVTANAFNIGNWVRLCEFKMSARYLNEAERIDQLETFDGLSLNAAVADRYAVNIVNARSQFVTLTAQVGPAVPFASPATATGTWLLLTNGDDGTAPNDAAFIGQDLGPGARTGLQALVDIDNVSLVAIPGKTSQPIQQAMIDHCELLKDRFAVLDPPPNATVQGIQTHRFNYDTKYAALYYPQITVYDSLLNVNRNMPPSGHILGIYARSDQEFGVHKAPANETIRGIVGLEQIISKGEQDILNPSPSNINVLRDFRDRGMGYRVYGARCITSDTAWKYINVRRLFIFLEESLEQGTQWSVFQPNDRRLWSRLRQSVTNFLTRVWRDGALMGVKPNEAFFVRCDETTMTQDDFENGRLIMLIGVRPVYPAEFVIIRIGQWQGGSSAEEL